MVPVVLAAITRRTSPLASQPASQLLDQHRRQSVRFLRRLNQPNAADWTAAAAARHETRRDETADVAGVLAGETRRLRHGAGVRARAGRRWPLDGSPRCSSGVGTMGTAGYIVPPPRSSGLVPPVLSAQVKDAAYVKISKNLFYSPKIHGRYRQDTDMYKRQKKNSNTQYTLQHGSG